MSFNYGFTAKNFILKLDIGICPLSRWGPMKRAMPFIGFTTKLKHPISWHICVGAGNMKGTKTIRLGSDLGYFNAGAFILNSGFIGKPFKAENICIGINGSLTRFTVNWVSIGNSSLWNSKELGFLKFLNLSVYYVIIKKKNEVKKKIG